jgi:dethiobiotin synthetase/adenosylmethionine--8-amino-7-oxononanoate aminotransferase
MDSWLFENRQAFDRILSIMEIAHVSRVKRLRSMAGKAGDVLWWPFTQHGLVGTENVTVIDSRTGDDFAVYSGSNLESGSRSASGESSASTSKPTSEAQKETLVKKEPAGFESSSLAASPNPDAGFLNPETLNPSFDACASWWTQGVSLEGQLEITRAMAYAAGRYGHVMFPENVHEPALRLAEKLLGGVGKGEGLTV